MTTLYLLLLAQVATSTPSIREAAQALFVSTVLPLLFTGLVGLLAWIGHQAGAWLKAKAEGSRLAAVGVRVETVIAAVVADLEATLKPELAEATADGVLTDEEIAKLRIHALERVKKTLGEKGLSELTAGLGIAGGMLDGVLHGLIEKAVTGLKSSAPQLVTSPSAPLLSAPVPTPTPS